MKIAAILLGLAVICLVATSLSWLRAPSPVVGDPSAALHEELHGSVVDISARYAGRSELLDPRFALPAWHRFPREDAQRLFVATRTSECPPKEARFDDPRLAKAYAAHVAWCNHQPAPDLGRAPFMHPSGRSFAALASTRGETISARDVHILELGQLGSLDADDRLLASIPRREWELLSDGDRMVATPSHVILAEHDALGLSTLSFVPRATFEAWARHRAIELRPRGPSCATPASPSLCWESTDRGRAGKIGIFSSLAAVLGASFALVFLTLRERRRLHADRIHVLRTLTHELRTPATHLRLDIEPLRNAYDELPASTQEPLLRISDGIERLHRVLHLSARYMTLFESSSRRDIAKRVLVPSVRAMFEGFAEEWPEDVRLEGPEADAAITTDPEWLGVALRNLVENAFRHGEKPVRVTWSLDDRALVVRVVDAGKTPRFSMKKAIQPNERDPKSPGLGLGLSIVDRVATILHGELSHSPSPTTFELRVRR